MITVALLAAVGIAAVSYWLGDRWATQQMNARYSGVARTLSQATFPLKPQVIQSLGQLTSAELITLDADSGVIDSTISLPKDFEIPAIAASEVGLTRTIRIADRDLLLGVFHRNGPGAGGDRVAKVAVLFDQSDLQSARLGAASLPLITALSTLFLLTSIMLILVGRLIGRLTRLGERVDLIAEGQFEATIPIDRHDEIGLLGTAVNRMGSQLQQLWQQLSRTQGEKLLHQIAGGLAHQLRNSLTGARMGIELHAGQCNQDDSSLAVALNQVEQTEDYIRRLLLVAAGRQDVDRAGSPTQCLTDIRAGIDATAAHLKIDLQWQFDTKLDQWCVSDAPSLTAAVSNLVINAIQAAESRVGVSVRYREGPVLIVEVDDDGPGPPSKVAEDLFEPFVTSKPEGLGLGLPLVARAAERLGGDVNWKRDSQKTVFVMTAKLYPCDIQEAP